MLQTTDPVTREIIKNALMSAADTMALTVVRTARSAVIKHGMDFSTALFNAEGQQVAQGLTLPPHLGSMAPALEGVMNAFGDDVLPGDIFANNDPYEGASHLPDIFLFKPIFVNDVLIGWSCCIGHQTDIGGRVAGGNACDNTEIYQEGLILPPLKLYERRGAEPGRLAHPGEERPRPGKGAGRRSGPAGGGALRRARPAAAGGRVRSRRAEELHGRHPRHHRGPDPRRDFVAAPGRVAVRRPHRQRRHRPPAHRHPRQRQDRRRRGVLSISTAPLRRPRGPSTPTSPTPSPTSTP